MQGHGWEWQKPQLLQHPSHGRLHSRARLLFSGPSVRQRTLHLRKQTAGSKGQGRPVSEGQGLCFPLLPSPLRGLPHVSPSGALAERLSWEPRGGRTGRCAPSQQLLLVVLGAGGALAHLLVPLVGEGFHLDAPMVEVLLS